MFADWLVPGGRDIKGKFVISLQRVNQFESDSAKYLPFAPHRQDGYTLRVDWYAYAAPQKNPTFVGANSKVPVANKNKPTLYTPPEKKKSRPAKKYERLSPVQRPTKILKKLPSPRNSLSGVSFAQVLRGEISAQEYRPRSITHPD